VEAEMVGWELQLGDLGSLGVAFWISTGVAVFFGLVAIVVSVYFYRKSRRIKQLAYTVATANLIQDYSARLSGLKIEYKGKNPATISVSKIAIWNEGTETVNDTDVTEAEPLRIICDSEVLDWSVIDITTPANQFTLRPSSPVQSDIVFDYLDKAEGGIVQLVHAGKSSASIRLVGRVKGSAHAVKREFGPNVTLNKISNQVTAIGLLGIFATALGYENTKGYVQTTFGVAIWITTILLLAGFLFGFLARRFSMVPKRFDSARKIV
jgi:hypothetical protein